MTYQTKNPIRISCKNRGNFLYFDRLWFSQHQTFLLWLLNTPIVKIWFRRVLRIHGECSSVNNRKIEVIIPNAIFWRQGNKNYAEFRTHNKFSKRIYYSFKPVWLLLHLWDTVIANLFFPQYNLGFDTLTVYPDPDVETTSVDGRVWVGGQNAIWGTVRGTAGNNAADSQASAEYTYADSSGTSNQFATIIRGIFLFDTSALTVDATVSAATFSLYGTAKANALSFTDAHASLALVSSNPATNTALVNADFNLANFGSTRFATDFSYASFSTSAYNDMTLNASGIAAISETGITKFGTMFACDLDNTAPNWVSSVASYISGYYADQTATTNDPKLVVTYTLGGGVTDPVPAGSGIVPFPR